MTCERFRFEKTSAIDSWANYTATIFILEVRPLWFEDIGVVAKGFEQMKEEGLRLAFFITFEPGGEISEILKPSFL